MLRTLPALLLLASLTVPLGSQAEAGSVLIAWAPAASSFTEDVVYDVYGLVGNDWTHLGSTEWTTFVAPAGFDAYRVKYRNPAGDQPIPCVIVDPSKPDVYVLPSC